MSIVLSRARILIADDQPDVARTLCHPLQRSGAVLKFVDDAIRAYDQIMAGAFDLAVVDMKMPPENWGGLWLLRKLRAGGFSIPVLVLSGEGTQQQTIEALNLGANGWINKSDVGTDLEERCINILERAYADSLERAAGCLPTPLSTRIATYSRVAGSEGHLTDGYHTLEMVLRFIAVVGLSTKHPSRLPGIVRDQVVRPSMGTWLATCIGLASLPEVGCAFRNLFFSLMPDKSARAQVREQVEIRNSIAHMSYAPSETELDTLHALLTRFAHRAASVWRSVVAVPTAITNDDEVLRASILSLVGISPPRHDRLEIDRVLRTGQPILVEPGYEPVSLVPWLVAAQRTTKMQVPCFFFDGVKLSKSRDFAADAPLLYSNLESGERGIHIDWVRGLAWSAIEDWFSDSSNNADPPRDAAS